MSCNTGTHLCADSPSSTSPPPPLPVPHLPRSVDRPIPLPLPTVRLPLPSSGVCVATLPAGYQPPKPPVGYRERGAAWARWQEDRERALADLDPVVITDQVAHVRWGEGSRQGGVAALMVPYHECSRDLQQAIGDCLEEVAGALQQDEGLLQRHWATYRGPDKVGRRGVLSLHFGLAGYNANAPLWGESARWISRHPSVLRVLARLARLVGQCLQGRLPDQYLVFPRVAHVLGGGESRYPSGVINLTRTRPHTDPQDDPNSLACIVYLHPGGLGVPGAELKVTKAGVAFVASSQVEHYGLDPEPAFGAGQAVLRVTFFLHAIRKASTSHSVPSPLADCFAPPSVPLSAADQGMP